MYKSLKSYKNNLIIITKKKYPDWDITIALRYLPIVNGITKLGITKPSILEIGPGELGILPYLPTELNITGVDVDFGNRKTSRMHHVKMSGKKLPFSNSTFDIVVSVDTLEHVPPSDRTAAITEMVRVANKRLFLAYPTGKFAAFCDRFLDKYFRTRNKNQSFPYLSEHLELGLPNHTAVLTDINKALKKFNKKGDVIVTPNTNFIVWLELLLLGYSQVGFLTSIYILSLWLLPILKHINIPPTYRQLIEVRFSQ